MTDLFLNRLILNMAQLMIHNGCIILISVKMKLQNKPMSTVDGR